MSSNQESNNLITQTNKSKQITSSTQTPQELMDSFSNASIINLDFVYDHNPFPKIVKRLKRGNNQTTVDQLQLLIKGLKLQLAEEIQTNQKVKMEKHNQENSNSKSLNTTTSISESNQQQHTIEELKSENKIKDNTIQELKQKLQKTQDDYKQFHQKLLLINLKTETIKKLDDDQDLNKLRKSITLKNHQLLLIKEHFGKEHNQLKYQVENGKVEIKKSKSQLQNIQKELDDKEEEFEQIEIDYLKQCQILKNRHDEQIYQLEQTNILQKYKNDQNTYIISELKQMLKQNKRNEGQKNTSQYLQIKTIKDENKKLKSNIVNLKKKIQLKQQKINDKDDKLYKLENRYNMKQEELIEYNKYIKKLQAQIQTQSSTIILFKQNDFQKLEKEKRSFLKLLQKKQDQQDQ